MPKQLHTGFAIAIAWPETLCKQAGAWYDKSMSWLRVSKNNYYKVGHAAVVLVNKDTRKCHYFDFGRYHAPYGYGRVRDEETDHDLKITAQAVIEGRQISNITDLLSELLQNSSCHGTGYLMASYTPVHFEQAYQTAKAMQGKGAIPYGPFVYKGTNCSRFVKKVVLAGNPKINRQIALKTPYTLSPTPKSNVLALGNTITLFPQSKLIPSMT